MGLKYGAKNYGAKKWLTLEKLYAKLKKIKNKINEQEEYHRTGLYRESAFGGSR